MFKRSKVGRTEAYDKEKELEDFIPFVVGTTLHEAAAQTKGLKGLRGLGFRQYGEALFQRVNREEATEAWEVIARRKPPAKGYL